MTAIPLCISSLCHPHTSHTLEIDRVALLNPCVACRRFTVSFRTQDQGRSLGEMSSWLVQWERQGVSLALAHHRQLQHRTLSAL